MSRTIDENTLFKPKASKAETKADITNEAARAIIDDEASRREAKTAKLRQMRLDQEAAAAAIPAPVKPARKTPAKRRVASAS
jgi:hypothetical protein